MRRGRFFALFLAFFLCFAAASCAMRREVGLDFLKTRSFFAEVEGSLGEGADKTDFAARIRVERTEDGEKYEICYHAPEAMEGVTVTLERRGGEERVTASLGELSVPIFHGAVAGWLMPVEALLSVADEPPLRLQKSEQGYRFAFDGEKTLTVDEKGLPISFISPEISLFVVRIEGF